MHRPRVALVSRDPEMRFLAARAFDEAPAEWHVGLFESPPQDADVVVVASDVDADGIRLDLDDPSRTFAAVGESLAPSRQTTVIGVASPHGGAGCTSLALHLASVLARHEPALYVEGDRSCGGRLRLGLDLEGPSWSDAHADAIDGCAIPVRDGFRALLAPEDDQLSPALIDRCRRLARFVIVDLGVSGTLTEPRDEIIVVVLNPSVPSARRGAAWLAARSLTPVVVTNRLGPGSELTDATFAEVLGSPVTLTLPCSPALRDAEDEGRLLVPESSSWSRRVARLAAALRS